MYQIVCPECEEPLTDANRMSSTVKNPFKGMPGGESYVYTYRCPACGATITWTQEAKKPVVHIRPASLGEED